MDKQPKDMTRAEFRAYNRHNQGKAIIYTGIIVIIYALVNCLVRYIW